MYSFTHGMYRIILKCIVYLLNMKKIDLEEQRPIPGTEGRYVVTRDGRVFDVTKSTRHGYKQVALFTTNEKSYSVVIWVGGVRKCLSADKLAREAFKDDRTDLKPDAIEVFSARLSAAIRTMAEAQAKNALVMAEFKLILDDAKKLLSKAI